MEGKEMGAFTAVLEEVRINGFFQREDNKKQIRWYAEISQQWGKTVRVPLHDESAKNLFPTMKMGSAVIELQLRDNTILYKDKSGRDQGFNDPKPDWGFLSDFKVAK